MITKSIENLEYQSLNDEEGLTGIICPECGKRIPLLDIFSFDAKRGFDRNGMPLFENHVDMQEDYECECGRKFRVYLDCKYAIGNVPVVKQEGKFQQETIVPLYDNQKEDIRIMLPEK